MEDMERLPALIEKYQNESGTVIGLLQDIHEEYGYLPEDILEQTAKDIDVPLSTLYSLATFYSSFRLEPMGKHHICTCVGTACHVKGAADILSTFERELGIKMGETTADKLFTLEAVMCIGCCGLAPVLKVNENVHGLMTKKEVPKLIKKYREAQNEKA